MMRQLAANLDVLENVDVMESEKEYIIYQTNSQNAKLEAGRLVAKNQTWTEMKRSTSELHILRRTNMSPTDFQEKYGHLLR